MDSESKKAERRIKDCRLLEILQYVHIPYIYFFLLALQPIVGLYFAAL